MLEMNILFVTDHYTPSVNGIVRQITHIRKELQKRGHRVFIVAPKHKKSLKEKDVHRLPATITSPLKKTDLLAFPFDAQIEKKLLKTKIDIVHSHLFLTGFFGLRIAQKKNIPTVVTLHTIFRHYTDWTFPWAEKDIRYRISDILARNYFNRFDAVISPSQKASEYLKEVHTKASIRSVHNGIDLKLFSSATQDLFTQTFKIDKKRPLIIMAGRVDRGKNVDLGIRSIQKLRLKLPNVLFVIVGDGSQRKKMEELIKKLQLENNVLITGFVNETMVASAQKAASVVLFTSDTDTSPVALMEALASKKPVVAIKDSAIMDFVIDGKNGFLVGKNQQAITDALLKILKDPKLKKQFEQNSGEMAKKFSIESCVDKLEKVYKDLIAAQNQKPSPRIFSFLKIFSE